MSTCSARLCLQHPGQAEEFGRAIAAKFKDKNIEVVASPAIGGLIVGHEVARALGARFIWTERDNGKMTLRRGFALSSARKNTGGGRRCYHRWFDARNDRDLAGQWR